MPEGTNFRDAATHDIIAIGASAGGLQPLQRVLADLPADLPAAVFVVLHIGASSHLAEILDRAGPLPVSSAEDGRQIERGHVYVAVPERHLMLHHNHVMLRRGPRENMARPAIDPLFRSAACTFGARAVGVVLSGALNDGSAGLRAIRRCGGVAVVQDPAEAAYPDMPRGALRHAEVDHILPSGEIGGLLARLAREKAGETPDIPIGIRLETAIAAQELAGMATEDRLGTPSRFTCPECHGTLWEITDGSLLRYRCHVGHSYTAEAMLSAQGDSAEEMLWSLLRSQQERAEFARRLSEHERRQQRDAMADRLERRARDYDEGAEVVRRLLRDSATEPTPEAAVDDPSR